MKRLTRWTLATAARRLARRDRDLGAIVEHRGTPPLWARRPGFPTLARIILEQQVSLASAAAVFERLREAASPLTPRRFLALGDDQLRRLGFSRQKTRYVRHLASAVAERRLRLGRLEDLPDEAVREQLTGLTGVGRWTADVYLLMALRRPDVWPSGDLALAKAVASVKRLAGLPSADELERLAEPWRPWRAVAARLLWHEYLSAAAARTAVNGGGRAPC